MTDADMSEAISDAQLCRNLAEDVPDMAPEIRTQLRAIATRLDQGEALGTTRCRRCGDVSTIRIRFGTIGASK